jgi:hypothetical protein
MSTHSKLKEAIEKDELIVFAGSGTSISLGLPNWKTLVIEILEDLVKDYRGINPYIELIKSDEITALDALTNLEKHKGRVLDYVSKRLRIDNDKNFSLHEKVFKLSTRVITTNYDKAFEYASQGKVDVVNYDSSFQHSRLSSNKNYIFKIHGDINSPDKCILFRKQYELLYSSDNSFLAELKKLLTDKTILFLGFSLNDPYVDEIISHVTKIYEGYNRQHFLLTADTNFENHFPGIIEPILLDSYTLLPSKLDELIAIKNYHSDSALPNSKNDFVEDFHTIALLHANPIDKEIKVKHEQLIDQLARYNIQINVDYLNLNALQNLSKEEYLFCFTSVIKNKLVIENEYLTTSQVTLQEIDDNIGGDRIKAVIVFYQGDEYVEDEIINLRNSFILINVVDQKLKDVINKFHYHFFIKHELPRLNGLKAFNIGPIVYQNLKKGIARHNKFMPIVSKYIDAKLLAKFVGRKTDIEIIVRKLIDLRYDNQILTIKGAGGIGKTTLVTKSALEIAERGYFSQGIHFIPCQAMLSFENFSYEISQCFELTSSINVEDQIRENYVDNDRLIILDNYETLLNIQDREKIIQLTSFVSDYACIVTTTRQILDLDFEEVYDLRNFTTDEAVQLFKVLYPSLKESDDRLLRNDICENLLNNNPLAIKLVAKGLPMNKNLNVLKGELEENIFRDDNIEQIFERPEDINIEKSKSLYHSINYSYQKLTDKEKFAFEILSLFPDGIHMENLKKFVKSSTKAKHKIEDRDIRNLDNKSLLENANNFLKLQSIISRFADHQFKKQEDDVKRELYTLAYEYNRFVLLVLSNKKLFKSSSSIRLLDHHFNNFLKTLDFLQIAEGGQEDKLDFIDDLTYLFIPTNQPDQFLKRIKQLKNYFDIGYGQLAIDIFQVYTAYWTSDFESTFERIKVLMPFSELYNLDTDDIVQKIIFTNCIALYECEGYSLEIINLMVEKEIQFLTLEHKLFKLGYHTKAWRIVEETGDGTDFTEYEIKNILGLLTLDEIEEGISKLYKKETLELVQCTYVKSKLVTIPDVDIRKLVISNPYTKGIIKLMEIKNLTDRERIKKGYIEALGNLSHIKYYYLEALYQFCFYLQSVNDSDFSGWHSSGLHLAKDLKYSYLIYLFEKLCNNDLEEYDEVLYTSKYAPLADGFDTFFEEYLKQDD